MPIHHQRTHPRDIRRLHKKSRLGCQTCKRRKVKCDETKPTCNKCASFGVPCDYSPSATINCREASTSAPDKPRRGRPRSNWASWAEQIRLSSTGEPAPPASNGLNVDDFELFHNYMTKTLDTVDDERKLFRDGIPRLSFQSPGILSLILAFSAYHLAKTRSFEAERYVSMAERHMALALRSATALLQNMSRENGSALYVTAVLVCFTAFAKGPLPGDLLLVAGEGQVAWLSLLRGVRLVVSTTGWSCIFNGVLAPYAPQPESSTTTRTVSPESDLSPGQLEDWQLSLNEVSDLIDICGDKELKATYRSDFEMLNKSFTLTFGTGCHARRDVEGRMEVILAWVYQIDDPFVRGMSQEDPVALIILGHFCVLLFTLRRYWFLEGWATHILEEILRRSPASRKWLHWPLQYVQGQEEGQ